MVTLWHGDCLEKMKDIPDKSVDMILTDPPYGTTACKWDIIIPFEPMWIELKRIIKDSGAICLFGSEPFSSHLRLSNIKAFKYDWIWKKDKATGFLNAKKQPMRQTENISVFYSSQCTYNPQLRSKDPKNIRPVNRIRRNTLVYGVMSKVIARTVPTSMGYPQNILEFNSLRAKWIQPTQKPVPLLEYLIKTYTLEGEVVLDFTMGSGSTGVACKNLNRSFIGIEKDEEYFKIAKTRINQAEFKVNAFELR